MLKAADAQRIDSIPTGVIEQRLVLTLFAGSNQVPDEAFDLVVTFVVFQTINQQSPEDQRDVCRVESSAQESLKIRFCAHLQMISMSLSVRCHLKRPWFKMSFHRPQLDRAEVKRWNHKMEIREESRMSRNRIQDYVRDLSILISIDRKCRNLQIYGWIMNGIWYTVSYGSHWTPKLCLTWSLLGKTKWEIWFTVD